MFGYVVPDKPFLYIKDYNLYRGFYCGLCKSLGKNLGAVSRMTLNFDMAFMSALLHNYLNQDILVKEERCITHWIKKRIVVQDDEITKILANLNVILAYHKLNDDVLDEKKGFLKRRLFRKAFRKASKDYPDLNRIVVEQYQQLLVLERNKEKSLDLIAEPFGNMMKSLIISLNGSKKDDFIENLCYNIGKWIYLIDALDDFEKDLKKNSYNPFIYAYPEIKTKTELVYKCKDDLNILFNSIFYFIRNDLSKIEFHFNTDLTDNILLKGIPFKTETVMKCCKCKKIKL